MTKTMKLADSHVHLNQILHPIESILHTSPQVKLMVNIGTLLEDDFSKLVEFEEIYCSYGIHPNDYLKENSLTKEYIGNNAKLDILHKILKEKIINTKKCVAIGETGLDFFYGEEESPIQYELLHMQLALAKELKKPLSIHARQCNLSSLIKIISSYGVKFVLHCYSYDLKNAMLAIEHGAYISFSGILTFGKNVEQLEETAANIPRERILIETDAPYLAPIPYRGKPNHPKYLIHTLEKLSHLRKEEEQDTAAYTFQNTLDFYNIKI